MKAVILAAGLGSRLKDLTKDKPKCLVEYKNQPLISYQINALLSNDIKDIAVVGGYKIEVLKQYLKANFPDIKLYENKKFNSTNMTYSLFCASEFMDDDVIISYSDIVINHDFIKALKCDKHDFSIMVDKQWLWLWQKRFSDVLSDAESMVISGSKIKELGKKPKDISSIDAQYIGLFKFKKSFLPKVKNLYENLDKNAFYDTKDYKNMYMTSFLMQIINKFDNANAIYAPARWLEVDSKSDLKIDILANLSCPT